MTIHRQNFFFTKTRGLCIFALLVNRRSQGLRPLRAMLAKSHLFLANIKQILMRYVYMRNQEKKGEEMTEKFHYTDSNLAKLTSLWSFAIYG